MARVLNSTVLKKILYPLQHYQCLGFPQASLLAPVVPVLILNNSHFYHLDNYMVNLPCGHSSVPIVSCLASPLTQYATGHSLKTFLVTLGPYLQMAAWARAEGLWSLVLDSFSVTLCPREIRHLFLKRKRTLIRKFLPLEIKDSSIGR